jgi:tripartite-type tricarboxylate transporter receptor subunit TctC
VIWLGLIAPKGTPPAVVNRLNAEVTKIVSRADVQAEWGKQGAVAMTMTADAFGRYLAEDIVKWERIVKLSGARADR